MGSSGDKKHKKHKKQEKEEGAEEASQGGSKRKRDRGEDDKKSKKHKKEHKKESKKKKSKSRKKEKEHKRERGRKSGGGDDNGGCGGNSPRQALVSLLAHHPGVVEELVLVLRALEAGQGVALDGIPVPEMRKRMGSFLDALGLRTELQGLAAATTYLLTGEQEAERDPLLQRTLRAVEAALGRSGGLDPSVRAAEGRMAVLLAAYPALGAEHGEEVQSLLLRVLEGESVVLAGLDDPDLRSGLEGVLAALGLERRREEGEEEEEGYALPAAGTGGKGGKGKGEGPRAAAAERVGALLRLFARKGAVPPEAAARIAAVKAEEETATAAAPSSSSAEGEGKGKPVAAAAAAARVVRGPAMPDAAMLAEAGRMMAEGAYAQEEGQQEDSSSSSDDDDDVVGPSLGDGRAAVPDEVAYRHLRQRQAAAAAKAGGGGREEWMNMAPDELTGQDNSHMDRLRHVAMTSQKPRGFNQRSERNRLSNPTGPAAPRNALEAAALRKDAEEAKKTKSLLEKHQEKVGKEEKAAKKARAGKPPERVPWSRELMEGRKEMDKGQAGELFKMATELGSRFSRTFR